MVVNNAYHHPKNYFTLNPNAPEFHPFYHFSSPNYNNTFITTNYHILNPNTSHGYPSHYHPSPPPPLLPPAHHYNVNFTHVDHQTNVVGQAQPHVRTRPKWVGEARRSGIVGNNDKKLGLFNNNNNNKEVEEEEGIRVSKGRSWGSSRGKMGKNEIMKVKFEGLQTTAMIRNLPNQFTRAMLVKILDEFCNKENQKLKSKATGDHPQFAFDFVYLPIDFRRGANKGYAFVNFTHPITVWKFHLAFSDRGWEDCMSPKICQIAYAAIQGKEKLMEHFGRSTFHCNEGEYLPVCFSPPRDGSGTPVKQITIGQRISLSTTSLLLISI